MTDASKKSHRRMGGVVRVGQRVTSEVRCDQSHLVTLSSHQVGKRKFTYLFNTLPLNSLKCFHLQTVRNRRLTFNQKNSQIKKNLNEKNKMKIKYLDNI